MAPIGCALFVASFYQFHEMAREWLELIRLDEKLLRLAKLAGGLDLVRLPGG
jgi:hypothetical protein